MKSVVKVGDNVADATVSEEEIRRAWRLQVWTGVLFSFAASGLLVLVTGGTAFLDPARRAAAIWKAWDITAQSGSAIAERVGIYLVISTLIVLLFVVTARLRGPIQQQSSPLRQYVREAIFAIIYLWCASIHAALVAWVVASGRTRMYFDISEYGYAYYLASFVLLFFIFDLWFYLYHRLLHTPFLFRYVHCVHHLSTKSTLMTPYQMSPVEIVALSIMTTSIIFVIPLHPTVLIGVTFVAAIKSLTSHSGYEIYSRAFVDKRALGWITAVSHHDLHHSGIGYNYAFFFTWCDRFFGTEHPRYAECVRLARAKRGTRGVDDAGDEFVRRTQGI